MVQSGADCHQSRGVAGLCCHHLFRFLDTPAHVHEHGVKVGAYILGEFGDQISEKNITGQKLFDCLYARFKTSSNSTKALLLSAFIKMANTYLELKPQISAVLNQHRSYVDCEIQQRACEYFVLNEPAHSKLMESVLDVMPNYSERESLLLKRIKKAKTTTTDRDVWGAQDPRSSRRMRRRGRRKRLSVRLRRRMVSVAMMTVTVRQMRAATRVRATPAAFGRGGRRTEEGKSEGKASDIGCAWWACVQQWRCWCPWRSVCRHRHLPSTGRVVRGRAAGQGQRSAV